jgi:hypothetical protein
VGLEDDEDEDDEAESGRAEDGNGRLSETSAKVSDEPAQCAENGGSPKHDRPQEARGPSDLAESGVDNGENNRIADHTEEEVGANGGQRDSLEKGEKGAKEDGEQEPLQQQPMTVSVSVPSAPMSVRTDSNCRLPRANYNRATLGCLHWRKYWRSLSA